MKKNASQNFHAPQNMKETLMIPFVKQKTSSIPTPSSESDKESFSDDASDFNSQVGFKGSKQIESNHKGFHTSQKLSLGFNQTSKAQD